MRAAVVTSGDYSSWDERSAILSRFVGALACIADVDLLVAEGPQRRSEPEGATTRETFPARPPDPSRLRAVELLAFGPEPTRLACGCLRAAHGLLAAGVPREVEEELVSLAGGDSPELLDHLATSDYDLVAFTRSDTASTVHGLKAVGGRIPALLLPLVHCGPRLSLHAVGDALAMADCVVATTAYEAAIAAEAGATELAMIGSVLRVHSLAHRHDPVELEDRAVLVARDWTTYPPSDDLLLTVLRLNQDLAGRAVVRLVGPGWRDLPFDIRATYTDSRLDVWRWMVRSLALWEPDPYRLLAREVLEAMQYGTPVITTLHGAAQEHADQGNGGLWYRTYDELLACIEVLAAEEGLRRDLGEQGRSYAVSTFAGTDAYVDRVERLVAKFVGSFR